MKSIVIFNNKGGVGKTTLLCNLASFLKNKRGKRVLIIDADPQCNASIYLFPEDTINELYSNSNTETIYDIFTLLRKGKGYINKESIPIMASDGFDVDVILGDTKLAILEDFLSQDWISGKSGDYRGLQTTFVFQDLLNKLEPDYDFVIFDIGPSLGAINRAVLLACDFFIIPMSSDIFSLKAIDNISESLCEWQKGLRRGLEDYTDVEKSDFKIDGVSPKNKLTFLGYVYQQYTAKKAGGVKRPVKAYDNIIKKMPNVINTKLKSFYEGFSNKKLLIGEIPTLNSLVPLSQSAHKAIFKLTGSDGVVGAHFRKVVEFEKVICQISDRVINNIEEYDKLAK